jgi:D-sedoheptulose 7-phosphate isomerase
MSRAELLRQRLVESIQIREQLLDDAGFAAAVEAVVDAIVGALRAGDKVLFCGNGGSAADAQHLAAELVGRLRLDRQPFPAIALADNVAALTAIANDYGYTEVFARGVRAFGRTGDVLIGLSTSGRSQNVLEAMRAAGDLGLRTIALVGNPGSPIQAAAELSLAVPGASTASIQEVHKQLGHVILELVEAELCVA